MSGCTILVSGLPNDVLKEDLQIYFQNRNTSGGGDIASIEVDDERGEAKIEFVDASVTETVLGRTHEYQSYQLTVQEYKPSTDKVHKDEPKSASVLVSGLSDKFTTDALEMYFENTRRSDGGDVTDVEMKGDKAVLTFASADVAKRVLARTHEYQGCQLTVEEYQPFTDQLHQDEAECTSVLVSGFSDKCTKDALEMYFENARRSGGGDVTDVEMKGDKAIVTFASADVVERVLARTHEYQGCQLIVEEYKPSTDECTSVLVSGFSDKCTKDALEMYFENARRSGGGDVTDVEIRGDKAVVTFASADVVERVLARTHEYQGCQLTVEEYKPSIDEVLQDEPECTSVLVSGFSDKCTKDALEMYFENARRSGGGDVTDVEMKGDKAVVTFASADVAKQVVARTHEYQGCQLTVQEYQPSTHKCTSVLVSGLSDKCTKDALEMYFENARRSGGGDVTDVEMKGDKAVVTFASSDVVKRVLTRTHEYQGCQLTVEEYQPFTDQVHQDEAESVSAILVSGLSDKCTKDALEMYFENARRSGGGDVTDVQVRGDKAVVTFSSPVVVERVLARTHEYQGCQLIVEEYKPSTDECASILVSGLSEKCTKDALEMYFENTRRSGGGDVTEVEIKGDKAVVTFASADVAKRVLARTHEYQGCQLTVAEYNPSTDECASVLVSGLSDKCTKDALEMYFENARRSGGGDVTDIEMKGDIAVVTFASPDAAQRVLARKHEYQECQLTVEEYQPSTNECASLLVSGITSTITDGRLRRYFENARQSGGGKVTSIQRHGSQAVVTFASPSVVTKVLEIENHHIDGCQLTVSRSLQPQNTTFLQEDVESEQPTERSRVVRVSGILEKTTKESLSDLFENTRRSGGGAIENIQLNKDEGFADITFCHHEVAERVSQKKTLEFDGARFTMTLKEVSEETPRDPKRLHVKNISSEISAERLTSFIEVISGEEVENVVFGSNLNALFTFKDPPDFKISQEKCSTRPLEGGRHLEIEQVNICDCIEVTGFAPNTTHDTVFHYFDNPRNGGHEVEKVKMDPDDTRALVFFKDPSVVNNVVTKQDHVINGAKLKVVPCYPFLGETSASPGVGKAERIVKANPQTMVFINKFVSQEFDQLLQERRVKYTWQQGSKEIVLGCAEPKMDKKTWKNSCDAVVTYINQIVTEKIAVSEEEVWKEMCREAKQKCVLFEDRVIITCKEKERSFTLTGKKTDVSVLTEQLEDLRSETEKQIIYEKSKIKKSISLTVAQFELFKVIGFVEDLQSRFKNLEMTMSEMDLTITFRGTDEMVREGNMVVWKTLAKVKEVDMELTKSVVEIIRSELGKDFISRSFKSKGISAVVSFDESDTQLKVTAVDRETANRAESFMKEMTAEESIPLDEHRKRLVESEKWKEFKYNVQQSKLLKITEEPAVSTLWIAGVKEEVIVAKENVSAFFKGNVILHQLIETETGRLKFVFEYEVTAIKHLEESLKSQSVKITKKSENEISVSGTKEGIERAVREVEMIISGIEDRTIDLDEQPGMKKPFIGEMGQTFLSAIENEHKCVIERCTPSQSSRSNSFGAIDDGKSYSNFICSYVTSKVKKIAVYKGDLTKHRVDVIVNAANAKLKHDSGVAKSIVDRGGQEIQDECNEHIKQIGDLSCGEVIVTGAGSLPCKKINHVASPKWISSRHHEKTRKSGEGYEVLMLAQTVNNALQYAEGYNSIALPAICAGASGFPEDVCAKTLINSALEYFKENPSSSLTEVHFVDMKDSVINALHDRMKASFKKEPSFTDSSTPAKESKKEYGAKAKKKRRRFVKDDAVAWSKDAKATTDIKIMIVVGDLAKEEVEVLVNTVSRELDLSKNPCAKALGDAAGPGLQQECKGKGQLSIGEMLVTDGYNLWCKNVFHVAAGDWENGKGEAVLRSLIQSCLKEADKRQFSSISFPAIGTGKASFPRDVVARAFFEEAESFKSKNPQTTVNEVHLVIYPKDKPTVKAFEEEQKKRTGVKSIDESGEKLIQSPQKGIFHFGSVRLEVASGDITKQTTDAIAIASNKSLNVSSAGIVGKTIAKTGGPSIQEECNQLGFQATGSVVHTSAGSLLTKGIFHLVFDHQQGLAPTEITNAMFKCFKKADSMGITSIAVPAIGTGKGSMSAKDAAKAILSAITKLSQENPASVKHIRIVVFQDDLLKDFYKASEEAAAPSMWQTFKGFIGMGEVKEPSTENDSSKTSTPAASAMDEKMCLQVFAASRQDLDDVESRIKTLVREKLRKEEIHQEAIGNLSDSQIQRIMCLQKKHDTKIQIDKKVDRIVVRGASEDVFMVKIAINDILNDKFKEEKDLRFAELLFLNIQWSCVYDDGDEEPYKKETNATIEQAYENKEPFVVVKLPEYDDTSCRIDFSAMTETNLETDEIIKVKRQVKTAGIRLPVDWDPQPTDSSGKEIDVHLVALDSAKCKKEYDEVKKAIEKTSKINIVKIERIQKPSSYRAYVVKKQELDNKNGSNEKKLFHGTAAATCELINHHGFNRSYCGKNATAFGQGVYFARDASYSMRSTYSPPDSVGNRYMYLVSVLIGEYTKGSQGMIAPPPKDPNIPTITYDSLVNDVSNPQIFVVFHDDQNYPEYLITFK